MGQEGVRWTEERRENPGSHSWRDSRSVQTNRGGTPRRSPSPTVLPLSPVHIPSPHRGRAGGRLVPLGWSSVRLQPVKELRNSSTKVWDACHRSTPDGLCHAAAAPLRRAKPLSPPLLLRFSVFNSCGMGTACLCRLLHQTAVRSSGSIDSKSHF